ncbi:MAG: trigger factor [Ruminococcus sp.]|nr:trigger factor [Ruminococcus sp.]
MSLKSTEKIETNKYELEIEISAEAFEAAVQSAYLKAKKNISVAGFRKGHAPRKVVEKEYGEGVFYEDALNAILPAEVDTAVEEAGLELVDRPSVEVTEASKEKGAAVKVTCITKPEIEIKDYKGIEVEKSVKTVSDEDVDHEIEHLREKGMRRITVEDRPAQNGDDVVIDFEGFKDNVAFEGGKAEKFTLSLGSGQFIPGFEEQIVGHNTGDEFDIDVTFPEDYGAADLAGAPVVFKIKLHEITAKELPELDDDFVKDQSEFDTVDELKADIRAKLEESAKKSCEQEEENKILDELIAKVEGEIPEVMYERRTDEMIEELGQRLAPQGVSVDMYLQYTGMTMDSLKTMYREQAEKQVKLRLALEKISTLEAIEVTDDEAEEEFKKMADNYNMDVEQVKGYVSADALKKDIAVGKAAELVKKEAVIK